jgi:hypothetical protein
MSFHKIDRNKIVIVGKKLKTKTFKSVTKFFEAQLNQNKNDSMFECIELECIKKRIHVKFKSELHDKICAHEDKRRAYQTKCKLASCNAQCRPYNDRNERRQYIDCNRNRAYNDKRQVAKRPCIERSGNRNRKDNRRNNQPKKLGHEKPRSNSKVPCPIHSFSDEPAKHSWANCSKNPANQKKPALQSAVDAHHAAIDDCYLSNNDHSAMELDRTEAADDQSIDHRSSSNFDDVFVTFLAPPPPAHNKVAENVKRGNQLAKKKRKTIASSDNDGKDLAYAQSTLASAKGLEEPLAFLLESN